MHNHGSTSAKELYSADRLVHVIRSLETDVNVTISAAPEAIRY